MLQRIWMLPEPHPAAATLTTGDRQQIAVGVSFETADFLNLDEDYLRRYLWDTKESS